MGRKKSHISKHLPAIPLTKSVNLDRYFNEIGGSSGLGSKEEFNLCKKIQQGDTKATHDLVTANLRFVVSVARNYANQGVALEDLINEGNLGLIKAARKFDAKKNFRFISYAVWWIRQAILQALAEQSRITRIPLNRATRVYKLGQTVMKLEQEKHRKPTTEEIAAEMRTNENEIVEILGTKTPAISLDAPIGENSVSLSDLLRDENADPPDTDVNSEMARKVLIKALESIGERERTVLIKYYGLDGEMPRTLEEIGEHMRLTRERVRQLKDKGQDLLRRSKDVRKIMADIL